jgi:DNA-binding transcriptional regulator YhcF (GntR family)
MAAPAVMQNNRSMPDAVLAVISIDPASSVPPFEQLRARLADAIASGELVPGERLPAVRTLAERLGLAAGTVARAVKELEADGYVETRGRNGTVVAPQGDPTMRRAQSAAAAYAAEVRRLRIDTDEAVALVAAALRAGS